MHTKRRRTRLVRALAGTSALALVLSLGLGAPGAAAEPGAAADPAADQPAGPGGPAGVQELTLLTGDTVVVEQFPDGRQGITVEPADRPTGPVTFDTIGLDGQTYVLPSDAAPLIPQVLDRELFNVTRLLEYGYTGGVPVIVQYDESDARASQRAPAGMTTTATLESIDAVAGVVDSAQWWMSVGTETLTRGASPASVPGVEKVWLDQLIEADLDESVPLIGAPELWDRGFDGTGVTIAVLDTGVDDTHPDLAGKVVAAENFTEEEDATDGHGHGTHVAGIAAGTGADSNGQFVGVAPGAELLNGKVLNSRGTGTFAGVIDGMEWAVDQGADIVNMSLGSEEATDGTDAAAQAVNQLTAEHDVLFVTSAGNSGPQPYTVGTPGSADAALTVGSVAKTGVMPSNSSRGPRLGDDAIKPDVTAPGVAITSLDRGSGYRALSGTSMASPHVAGAAAILLQSDAELSAGDLKAALATTGVPRDGLDVFDQGGGRIDVPAAFDAPVLATPAPLNLGFFPWPHDDAGPVEKQLTYTNRTGQPITLDLAFDVASRAGDVPDEAMLSLSTDTVTVGAGAAASVTVTVDVTEGEVGLYRGYLVAEQDGTVVTRTPVGFHKEPERFQLTVEGIARDGRPAFGDGFHVINVDNVGTFAETGIEFVDGQATMTVPAGNYAIMGLIYTYRQDHSGPGDSLLDRTEQVWVSEPEVSVFEDTTVVLDARDASRVVVETPGHDSVHRTNPHDHQSILVWRAAEDGGGFRFSTFTNYAWPVYATPTDPVNRGDFEFITRQRLSSPPDLDVRVVAPEQIELDPIMLVQSPPLIGELEAPVVDVGTGRSPEDYEGVDADGAVVLIERGPGFHAVQARNAANAGAVAVLVANTEPGPTFSVAPGAPLPTIGLSMADGDLLRSLLDGGETTVRLSGNPSAPVLFDLVLTEEGSIRDDLTYVADTDELAALEIGYHADVPGEEQQRTSRFFFRPWGGPHGVGNEFLFTPLQRTEYVVAEDVSYRQAVLGSGLRGRIEGDTTSYEPGERREVTWFKKPFRPGIRGADLVQDGTPTVRNGNLLEVDIREWVDAHGNGNWGFNDPSIDTTAFRLFTDGELTAEAERAIGTFPMSPDPATYRLELDVARDADWWLTSTQTRTAWTVHSAGTTPEPQRLPVLLVDYDVDLDLLNTAPHPRDRNGPPTVELAVRHQPGMDGPPIAGARAWMSYDDGESWRSRPVHDLGDGRYGVMLDNRDPADTSGFVSLRVEAWDADGNRIEQEIIRAWRIPPR